MAFLSFLESIRTPWLDVLMRGISLLGEESVFLVLALVFFWCIDKRLGYYLMTVGFLGTIINQVLKITCRIPRPWVRDPSLTVVEGAMEGAAGYSFPSGHVQNITGTMSVFALTRKRRRVTVVCAVIALLIAFSRMYLGVHTPADVGFSLLFGVVLALALSPLMASIDTHPNRLRALIFGMFLVGIAALIYVLCWPFPADIDPVNLAAVKKDCWSLTGAVGAMCLCCEIDTRRLHFPTKAVWWAQLLKIIIGLGLVLAVKTGLKPVLTALCGDAAYSHGIRYFLVVLVAALLWPISFRAFAKLGRK